MANQNTPSVPEQEQDSNTLRQIRLEKLRQRQADGNDPFTITKYDVTAKAASVKADYEVTEAKFKEEAGGDLLCFPGSKIRAELRNYVFGMTFLRERRKYMTRFS